jgi:peptidoglycan hydrolase-like protein with peptidoglycan-binding domain
LDEKAERRTLGEEEQEKMRHRWLTTIAIAGIAMLIAGPALAQGTGSGTSAPSGTGSSSGTTTIPQAAPSTQQPSPGTPMPSPSGKAQPGVTQGSSGTESPAKSSAGSKPGMINGQAARGGSEQVKKVQKALQEKGADPGPVDGIMGPMTESALKSFQKDQKLPETGRLDSETLAKLGVSS